MEVTKKQFVTGASWKIVGDFSVKGITFLVSIVLMRLLEPEDYGLIALTAIFTSLSDIIIEGGFSTALVRKKEVDAVDYGCVLSISWLVSLVLYVSLFAAAPAVARYYDEPRLTGVLRAIGVILLLQAFTSLRTAIVNRNMQFKLLSICNTIGSVISGVIGIAAAYFGMGVWALVIQRVSQVFITNALLFVKVKIGIKLNLKWSRLKEMMKFSLGVVGSSLINYLGGSIYSAVIGKKHSVEELGYYDKGSQLPMQLSLYTFGSMSSVLLPTLSACQDDLQRVKAISRKVVGMTAYILFPMMVGLILTSREITLLLFSEKWIKSVPMMKSFCIYYLATPFMLINVQVFFALGHSYLRVKTEIIRLVLMGVGLVLGTMVFKFSVSDLALMMAVIAVIAALTTFVETRKLIDYSWKEVINDIWRPLFATAIMAGLIIVADRVVSQGFGLQLANIVSLAMKAGCGVIVYLILSKLMKMNEFGELLQLLKSIVSRRRKPAEQ